VTTGATTGMGVGLPQGPITTIEIQNRQKPVQELRKVTLSENALLAGPQIVVHIERVGSGLGDRLVPVATFSSGVCWTLRGEMK
jgi:hypothetical protein